MNDTWIEILSAKLKNMIPILSALGLVLIAFIELHLPFLHSLRPDVACISVYFWVLYRLDLFGIFSTFFLGLIVDSLSGAPFGMNVFVLSLVYVLTISYGSYVNTKPFLISWLGFAAVFFAALVFKWVVFSVYYRVFLSFWHIFITYAVTVLIYPLIARLNMFLQNRYLADEGV